MSTILPRLAKWYKVGYMTPKIAPREREKEKSHLSDSPPDPPAWAPNWICTVTLSPTQSLDTDM